MDTSNYIKIFTGSLLVVQLIKDRLEAININPVIKDESESARLAGFGTFNNGQQFVFVHKDELDKAVEVVELVTADLQT